MIYKSSYQSPLGEILLAADDQGLTGLWFAEGERYVGRGLSEDAVERDSPFFDEARRWLDVYFSGKAPDFTPTLHLVGSEFRNRVAELLLEIPFGKTTTYGALAGKIAEERGLERFSSQAVGGAVGKNPILLIVPCHRVVGANGDLTGYGGGIERKAALLRLEKGEHE